MTEITDLSTTDSSNTAVTGESIDGAIANMGRMDNTLQAILGLLARSIRTNVLRFLDNADPTKKVALDLSGLPTATERTWTAPYYSGTLGLVSDIRGQIFGLTLSNNVTDPTNDIDIAAGSAVDSTGSVSMLLASSLTKRLDAAWAVGSGNGWLDTGVIANTTYHVFLIRRPDTGVVDSLASTSPTAPTLPANYTQFRRIGAIIRVAAAILSFSQNGDEFLLGTPVLDVNANNPGTSAVLRTLTVPAGIKTTALLNVAIQNADSVNFFSTLLTPTDVNDVAPIITGGTTTLGVASNSSGGSRFLAAQAQVRVDASRQIRSRSPFSDANCTLYIATRGWIDNRGQV